MKRIVLILFAMLLVGCTSEPPVASNDTNNTANMPIDISKDPIQIKHVTNQILLQKGTYKITPLAKYTIAGKVLKVITHMPYEKSLLNGESVYPIDIGIAWGPLAVSNYTSFLKYKFIRNPQFPQVPTNQSLKVDYIADLPNGWDTKYIMSHLSNTHIIPANKNVYNAIKNLKPDQIVELKGYLVQSDWGGLIKKSSLSRTDMNNNNDCEDMFVERVRVDNEIFE